MVEPVPEVVCTQSIILLLAVVSLSTMEGCEVLFGLTIGCWLMATT
jgi:hypothetical protein